LKTTRNHIVSITKVHSSIQDSVEQAIDLAGGMEPLIRQGDEVYLKPNFVAPRGASQGVTTDLEIVRVVAEQVRSCGGTPILFETPAIEFDRDKVYDALDIWNFAKQNNIALASNNSEFIKIAIPQGKAFKSVKIPKVLHQAKIINLPKLKTHVSAKMTCAMKNLIGLLPASEKRNVHIFGLHGPIADICKVFRPIFTVVDATTCMEGDGPTYGDAVDLGLILAGTDMLSVDKICSKIIGIPWQSIGYLRKADHAQDNPSIKVLGQSPSSVGTHFRVPEKGRFFHFSFWLINVLDVLFSKFYRGHLNQFLYRTGYVGTNPRILRDKCNACGDCIKVCPVPTALNIDSYKVNYKECIRCLNCYQVCPKDAIAVKGISRPAKPRAHSFC